MDFPVPVVYPGQTASVIFYSDDIDAWNTEEVEIVGLLYKVDCDNMPELLHMSACGEWQPSNGYSVEEVYPSSMAAANECKRRNAEARVCGCVAEPFTVTFGNPKPKGKRARKKR